MAPEMNAAPATTDVGVKETGLMQMLISPTFQAMMDQALPKVGLTPERITRVIATEFRGNPTLKLCTPASFYRSIITCAELGLLPGPALGYCYIVPFRNHGVHEATFMLGYPGVAALSWRTGMLDSIDARTVYEGDPFEIHYGSEPRIAHSPAPFEKRGDVNGWYATIRVRGSAHPMFHYMSVPEAADFKDRYVRAKKGSPWHEAVDTQGYGWMVKKTCFKQAAKLAPRAESIALADAPDLRGQQGLPPEIDITDEANFLMQMQAEGAEVNSQGGFGANPAAPASPGPDDAATSQEPGPKYAIAKEGEPRCESPIAGGCVREKGHKEACMNAACDVETFK